METERKLEIGSGNNPTDGYIHLDINPKAPHVEIVGDIRTIFAYHDFTDEYQDLEFLKLGANEELLLYDKIILKHTIEHFHWHRQPPFLRFLYNILDYNGMLEIETPDLEWIVKTYVHGRSSSFRRFINKYILKRENKASLFPVQDHPDISKQDQPNLSRWLAFKIHSGGSYDKEIEVFDYHLGLYDKERLQFELTLAKFRSSVRRDILSGNLFAIAKKIMPKEIQAKDYYSDEINET